MTTYTPGIPQPTDLISNSQGQILGNFSTIDTGSTGRVSSPGNHGFSREHVTMTDAANGGLHAQATMLKQVSLPAPNAPAATYGTYYTSQTGSVPGNITEAVYKSGDSTGPVAILSAIKAWGVFGAGLTPLDGFNFASVAHGGGGLFTITFTNALLNANYAVLVSCNMKPGFIVGGIVGVNSLLVGSFQINVKSLSSTPSGADAYPISFVVLQS